MSDTTQSIHSLYNLKALAQLAEVNGSVYAVQSQLREVENDTHHTLIQFNTDFSDFNIVAENATHPTAVFNDLAYLKDGQLYYADTQQTALKHGISTFVGHPGSPVVTYLTTLVTEPAIIDEQSNRPDPRRITQTYYKADGYGLIDENAITEIHQLDLTTGTDQLIYRTNENIELLDVASDNRHIIFTQTDDAIGANENNHLLSLSIDDGDITDLLHQSLPGGQIIDARFSPDDQHILLVGHDAQYPNARISSIFDYNFQTAELSVLFDEDVDALHDFGSDFSFLRDAHSLRWIDQNTFEFIASYHGYNRIYTGNLDGNIQLTSNVTRSIVSLSDHYLIETTSSVPAQIIKRDDETVVFNPNQELTFTSARPYHFQSEDGSTVYGWFLPATHAAQKPAPVLLYVHGGPASAYSEAFFWEFQVWSALGYNVVYINPHGSTTYGQAFENAVINHYGEQDYRDIITGFETALTTFSDQIDTNRQYLAGGSYGGFMTTWIIGHDHRFSAAVAQRAVIDWISMAGTSDVGYPFVRDELGSDISTPENIPYLWKKSPIAYAGQVTTPTLLQHGDFDARVPLGQAEEYYTAVKTQTNTPIELLRFPQSWHGLSRTGLPSLRIDRIQAMYAWFEKY
ncbi:acylaminoacyl-peptidase [Weissella uvarum]|uniref:alpha/beta hydrolase family protein n=1 Tax=Weissella uvarum TaxID=1479233 RepID=UPI00196228E8|nr:S9 family peptidase [Weissella uvarum]MBM7617004.1 acylaminoacyl-peptidase [Weissella uvarum]MCM0595302.1 S9 family peptidase [Weissella uvarum]